MKFSALFILSVLCAYFFGVYLPHWVLMLVICLLAAIIGGKASMAFFSAALAVGAVWFFVPLWITVRTDSDFPDRMAEIMGLGNGLALFGLTALLGFLLGGLAGLTGNRLRRILEKEALQPASSHPYKPKRRW